MKKQVVIIHGGNAFKSYDEYLANLREKELDFERIKRVGWKDMLGKKLGQDFEVLLPNMPNPQNARYEEWKIWFEKLIPFLKESVVLVGHSMGATFLVKYLAENRFPKKIIGTFLVAGPHDEEDLKESLVDFAPPENLVHLAQQGGKIFFYHSKDDPVVPFVNAEKYQNDLPQAKLMVFEDREHFSQEEFPELIEDIKNLY